MQLFYFLLYEYVLTSLMESGQAMQKKYSTEHFLSDELLQ